MDATRSLVAALALAASILWLAPSAWSGDATKEKPRQAEVDVDDAMDPDREQNVDDDADPDREQNVDDDMDPDREQNVDDDADPGRETDVDEDTE